MNMFIGEKCGKKSLILMKTYFLNFNFKNYNHKELRVVLPDLAVSCQNSLTARFGTYPD